MDFDAPADGEYVIWARALGPDGFSDSFFVSVDGGGEDIFDAVRDKEPRDLFLWAAVNGRNGFITAWLEDPRVFALPKGRHTVEFRCREPGARLDKIVVTNDRAFKP
jgi:hypothetical protein